MRTVDVIANVLKEEGIDRIFGIPGAGASTDLIDAASKLEIEAVLTSHEGSAAMIGAEHVVHYAAHLEKVCPEDKDKAEADSLLSRTQQELSRLKAVLAQNGTGDEK